MSAIYRKGAVLGWGSLGAVYSGWGELLDRPVAVKELVQPFAGNERFSRTYLGQAAKMVDIAHPHVLATYAADASGNVPKVIRELADDTLGHLLLEGPLPFETVLLVLHHTLSGLEALHGRGLLHRAVKPENIFVCGDLYKIGDFGPTTGFEGEPPVPLRRLRYAAPERISESIEESPSSDLYSLGLVAYELIVGRARFERAVEGCLSSAVKSTMSDGLSGSDQLLRRFHLDPAELPALSTVEPGISPALSLVLEKMVAKDPAARYASCRDVLRSLGSTGLSEPAEASPKGLGTVAADRRRSHRAAALWIGGGLALALAVGITWMVWRGENPFDRTIRVPEAITLPPGDLKRVDPAALVAELVRLASSPDGLGLTLEGGLSEAGIPVGTPLSFSVTSNRAGYLLLFALGPDGSIACIYPNLVRPMVEIQANRGLVLPSAQDWLAGYALRAKPPLGKELLFLLSSVAPLPPLPPGASVSSNPWLPEYRASPHTGADPALGFLDWAARLAKEQRAKTKVAALEFEITSRP